MAKNESWIKHKIESARHATELPKTDSEWIQWQDQNRRWWESNPMRYDWKSSISHEMGTADYFKEIDSRFFESSREFLPFRSKPFEKLIDFEALRDLDVLEIGVGHGSQAQLIAPHCSSFTGIDLTDTAYQMAKKRFEVFGLSGNIMKMDAEKLAFPDGSFDWIWSWGVIHHSANPVQILNEIHRVLRKNGSATIMVYYRSFWKYWVECALVRGIFMGDWWRYKSLNRILQNSTDGAIARFYRFSEFRRACSDKFEVSFEVKGPKNDILLMPAGFLKKAMNRLMPDAFARFLAGRLRMGSFLIARLKKIGS